MDSSGEDPPRPPPDVLLEGNPRESQGMVGTPEEQMQALKETTTKMLQDSTPERVTEIAGCFRRPEIVAINRFPLHRADESNNSTQVAAEAITTPATDPPMHLMGSWETEPHIAAINAYWDTRSWGASSSGSQDLPDSMQVAAEKDYICCSSQ